MEPVTQDNQQPDTKAQVFTAVKGNKKNLFILVGGLVALAVTVAGVGVGVSLYTRATQSPEPQKIKVSNLSENSFTVSFTTDTESKTFISYGTTQELGSTAAGKEGTLHHIQVKGLRPSTAYFWKIGSGAKKYGQGEVAYQLKTAPTATVPPTPDEAFGRVSDGTGKPVAGALVYAQVKDADSKGSSGSSSLLSAQTTASGTFTIDLGNARTQDLASRYVYSRGADEVNIEAEAGETGSAQVRVKTNQTQPLADIVVSPTGGLKDLRSEAPTPKQEEAQETRTEEASPSAGLEALLEEPISEEEVETAQKAVAPAVELPVGKVVEPGSTITGTGTPNTTITITIQSEPITAQVTTDADGNWIYTLPSNLASGTHSITLADAAGNTVVDTFTVSGGEATPSAEATPAAEELPVAGATLPTVLSFLLGFVLLGLGLVTFKTAKSFS